MTKIKMLDTMRMMTEENQDSPLFAYKQSGEVNEMLKKIKDERKEFLDRIPPDFEAARQHGRCNMVKRQKSELQ